MEEAKLSQREVQFHLEEVPEKRNNSVKNVSKGRAVRLWVSNSQSGMTGAINAKRWSK